MPPRCPICRKAALTTGVLFLTYAHLSDAHEGPHVPDEPVHPAIVAGVVAQSTGTSIRVNVPTGVSTLAGFRPTKRATDSGEAL